MMLAPETLKSDDFKTSVDLIPSETTFDGKESERWPCPNGACDSLSYWHSLFGPLTCGLPGS